MKVAAAWLALAACQPHASPRTPASSVTAPPSLGEFGELGREDVASSEPPCGARELFDEARRSYRLGDYEEALAAFVAANACFPHPALRFNIALALAGLDRDLEAIEILRAIQADGSADVELRRDAQEKADDLAAPLP